MPDSVFITRAAELLRVSRRTIYNRIRRGELETIRVGPTRRVTLESLNKQAEFTTAERIHEYIRARRRTS